MLITSISRTHANNALLDVPFGTWTAAQAAACTHVAAGAAAVGMGGLQCGLQTGRNQRVMSKGQGRDHQVLLWVSLQVFLWVFHRIVEQFELEETFKIISSNSLAMEYACTYSSIRCSKTLPDGISKDGAPTNSLGNLCQRLTTFIATTFSLYPLYISPFSRRLRLWLPAQESL